MVLTNTEKRKGAREFARKHYQELRETADLNFDDIKAAFEALVDDVLRATTPATATIFQTWLNQQLPQPFKAAATDAHKATLLSIAALFEAGHL